MRPAALASARASVPVQLRLETKLPSEDYISQKAWLIANLEACPLHQQGGCSLRKVGYYKRVEPAGLRVPYWHCPEGHRVFSMLPDFAAARVSSSLAEIEQVVERFEGCRRDEDTNNESAAAHVRPDIERASAVRWVERRRRWVRAALAIAIGLMPEVFAGCDSSLASVRAVLDGGWVLVRLREIVAAHLTQMPAPVGFAHLPRARQKRRKSPPYKSGHDPPPSTQ